VELRLKSSKEKETSGFLNERSLTPEFRVGIPVVMESSFAALG
jgi:hypothetical protein